MSGNVNTKGFENKSVSTTKPVGPQGSGGSKLLKGGKVKHVSNPRGIEPRSTPGKLNIVQDAITPPVGK